MGFPFGVRTFCKGLTQVDEMKLSHQRLVAKMELNATELYLSRKYLELHIEELELSRKYLSQCLLILAAAAVVVILVLAFLSVFLFGVREEQKRRLEAQRYESIIQEQKNRIRDLEAEKAASQDSHQPQIVYAIPSIPQSPQSHVRTIPR